MDGLMVTTTSLPGCRWLLQGLERLITWARMCFKYPNSICDRKASKTFTSNLKDTAACQATGNDLNSWFSTVDKSGLPGKFKA